MADKILCGLDVGTNSVGWCVTDENFDVIKKKGKSLWGVRLFEEAKDAKERRGFRASRRRLHRRKERLHLLQGLFEIPMQSVDPSFFLRLKESFFQNEDRSISFNYTLFNDKNYTDKIYYKTYPTIYHLRKALIESEEKMDLRFIYLALHHMIKYRGHFLIEGSSFKTMDKAEADKNFFELKQYIEEKYGGAILAYDDATFNSLKEKNEQLTKLGELTDAFNSILNPKKNKFVKNIVIPFIIGKEVSVKAMEINDYNEEDLNFKKISPSDEDFEDKVSALLSSYPDEDSLAQILLLSQKLYQFFLLGKLLGEHTYLCDAMVEKYNEHQKDLRKLKDYIRKYHPKDYGRLFRKPRNDESNYSSYVGSYICDGEPATRFGRAGKKEGFYKLLKQILAKDETTEAKEILSKIEANNYLPLLTSTSNGVFPYQLNLLEMKIILEKQSKYYDFLNETDEDGSIQDKIISLLTFKIPYYVGPLSTKSEHAWIVRKEGKIYPWNFDRMVDKDASAAEFIKRMLNRCTYLPSAYCLPKDSLIFTYYNVLSFLNKIQVNGSLLSYEEKMRLIELFKTNRKVTKNDIITHFICETGAKKGEIEIATSTGKSIDNIACNMSSYYDFSMIFGRDYVDSHEEEIDQIIQDIVIFEDKNILEKRLKEIYHIEDLSLIKKIKGLNYSKYGRLSKEFLTDLKATNPNTGEVFGSILHIMEETNQNLEEVIHREEYGFSTLIEKYNLEHAIKDQDISIEEYVDDLYVNPGMKRGLIQAYKIIDELEKILGRPIDEFYVECSRTNKEKKKPSTTRYEKLKELYKEAQKNAKDDQHFKEMYSRLENADPNSFQSDRYFLYFLQMGRCMYSGEPIELDSLYDSSKYDIDHIIPQAMIKDDSLENRVLVKQELNREKSSIYPIPTSHLFHGNMQEAKKFYSLLHSYGFLTEEKFRRITRRGELKEEEYAAFVNRQLVYTNQAVAGLIKAIQFFKFKEGRKPKIVYSKAENVSDFRKQFELVKSRNANNYHHAHDAYLNIVVGRILDVYFSPYHSFNRMHALGLTTNANKVFLRPDRPVIDPFGKVIWDINVTLKKIKHQLYECYDILTTTRTYYGTTLFEKVTIYPKGVGNIGVKTSGALANTNRYGGLHGYAFGYYALIKIGEDTILEAIPTVFSNDLKTYLDSLYPTEYEIIIEKLKINTVIQEDKKKYCITGKTGNYYFLKNLLEKRFTYYGLCIIHKLEKLQDKLTKNKFSLNGKETKDELEKVGLFEEENRLIISVASNKRTKQIEINNEECYSLYRSLILLYQKNIYQYSAVSSVANFLIEKQETFIQCPIIAKIRILLNLLSFLKCNERKSIDLTILEGKSAMGTLLINKKLKSCKIISESITGFYKHVIWEVK